MYIILHVRTDIPSVPRPKYILQQLRIYFLEGKTDIPFQVYIQNILHYLAVENKYSCYSKYRICIAKQSGIYAGIVLAIFRPQSMYFLAGENLNKYSQCSKSRIYIALLLRIYALHQYSECTTYAACIQCYEYVLLDTEKHIFPESKSTGSKVPELYTTQHKSVFTVQASSLFKLQCGTVSLCPFLVPSIDVFMISHSASCGLVSNCLVIARPALT